MSAPKYAFEVNATYRATLALAFAEIVLNARSPSVNKPIRATQLGRYVAPVNIHRTYARVHARVKYTKLTRHIVSLH